MNDIPGGEPKAAHDTLSELYDVISGEGSGTLLKDLWNWLAQENSVFKALLSPSDGVRLLPGEISKETLFTTKIAPPQLPEPGMELILTDCTFGTEELSAYSRYAREGETSPRLFMHPDDARRLGLAGGEKVALGTDGENIVFELALASNMAPGVIVALRHRQVEWRKLKKWPIVFADEHIRRI